MHETTIKQRIFYATLNCQYYSLLHPIFAHVQKSTVRKPAIFFLMPKHKFIHQNYKILNERCL